jgi:hypothetical protein
VSAAPKAGKTVFSVQVAMCVAGQRNLFDYYSTRKKLGALILEWDDPQGDAALKDFILKARSFDPAAPLYFCSRPTPPLVLSDPLFLPWLGGIIEQQSIGLVVLDSYTALRGLRSGGDFVKLEAHEMTMLADLAKQLGIIIILIHHDSKSSAHLDWSSRAAGSFAVGAATDTLIRISRFDELAEDDGARLVQIRGRHLAGKSFVLRFREQSLDFDIIYEGGAALYYPDVKALHRTFAGAEASFTAKNIADELGWARPTIYRLLNRLTGAGILRKSGNTWNWDPNFSRRDL